MFPTIPPETFEVIGATQIVPTVAELEAAVARNSMSTVFTVLAIWQNTPFIVSLLLAVSRNDKLSIMEALGVGSVRILEAFLWYGWGIDSPIGMDGPSALEYESILTQKSHLPLVMGMPSITRVW